jgi:hypothetical protein
MYRRDHGKKFIKSLTLGGRKHYKHALSKTLRQQDREQEDRHAEPRCPYCDDNHCGGWCG